MTTSLFLKVYVTIPERTNWSLLGHMHLPEQIREKMGLGLITGAVRGYHISDYYMRAWRRQFWARVKSQIFTLLESH